MRKLSLLVSVALLAACGETQSAPASEADGAAVPATEQPVAAMTSTASAAAATASPAAEKPARIAALPLKRGFYIASDTPCGQASNATLNLLRRDGIGGSRDFCEFVKIEKTTATTYLVTEKCGELSGEAADEETHTAVWTITNDSSYSRKTSGGWESSARFCVQSSLPNDWRDNDISDLIK